MTREENAVRDRCARRAAAGPRPRSEPAHDVCQGSTARPAQRSMNFGTCGAPKAPDNLGSGPTRTARAAGGGHSPRRHPMRTPGTTHLLSSDRRTASGPRRTLWSLVAVLCAALAMLASACGAAPAPAAAHRSTAADLPTGGVPGVRVPTIEWADAGDGYQQATAQVPYDYARPRGRTLGLHLVRLPASDPAHRIGSLFVNFGGPGAPAAALVRASGRDMFPPEVLARYDLVGVDVRGTGESRPVRCFDDPARLQALPYVTGPSFPTTPAEEAARHCPGTWARRGLPGPQRRSARPRRHAAGRARPGRV